MFCDSRTPLTLLLPVSFPMTSLAFRLHGLDENLNYFGTGVNPEISLVVAKFFESQEKLPLLFADDSSDS